jgi:hypothetical protein
MGFALFDLSVFVTNVVLCLRMLRMPGLYTGEAVLHALLNSAKLYMLLSAPFILGFSAALVVSNISLIRHEGKRTVNFLGILLAFLMLAGEAFLFCYDYRVSGSLAQVRLHELVGNLFARRVKMRAVGMGAKTKWYFWPNAAVREFVGLLTEHRLKQTLILFGMTAFYVALTLLVYRK